MSSTGYKINGKVVSRREFLKKRARGRRRLGAMGTCAYSRSKPLVSVALACHPDQVQEFNEACRRGGLSGVRYLPDGKCEITSRGDAGRRGLLKALGLHDNDGGYGDG